MRDAIDPLLASCSSFALHEPVLSRLYDLVVQRPRLSEFARLIASVRSRKKFSLIPGQDMTFLPAEEVLYQDVAGEFAEHQQKDLSGTLHRMQRAAISSEDAETSRGVREL